LLDKITSLDEVIIISSKLKTRKFGNKSHNPFLWGNLQSTDIKDIVEFGQLIKLNGRISKVLSAHLYINGVDGIDTALVRINFYNWKNGKPYKRIVHKAILKKLRFRKGWINIDLDDFGVLVQGDFFIAYEILPEKSRDQYLIFYGGKLGGRNGFSRTNSHGVWEELHGASVSTYVRVEQ